MTRRDLVTIAVLGLVLAIPTAAGAGSTDAQPVIDVMEFIPEEFQGTFEDRNDDGLPDFRTVPDDGIDQVWKDQMRGAVLPAALDGLDADLEANEGSRLVGACRGIAISYDADGTSIDAIMDTGGSGPPIDMYGQQAMTRKNPMKLSSGGMVLYSGEGDIFHDHAWFIEAADVIRDSGGSPNDFDEFQRAGAIKIGSLAPFNFTALARAEGAWVDEWGDAPLPKMSSYPTPNCEGYGWVKFVGFAWTTIPGLVALTLLVVGLLGLLLNARPLLALAGAAAEGSRRRRPIPGALWGILFGLGLALALMVAPIIPASISNLILYTAIGLVAGTAWGFFGPPKGAAAAPPAPPPPAPETPPPAPDPADGTEGEETA